MTGNSGKKKCKHLLIRIGGWLFDVIMAPGWRRWVVFAVAAVLLAALIGILFDRINPAVDPSALTPREASLYIEARDVRAFLALAGDWPIWAGNRADDPADPGGWSRFQFDLTAAFPGLPLRWLTGAAKAAFSLQYRDEAPTPVSTLFLDVGNPDAYLVELRLEPKMRVEKIENVSAGELFRLSDGKGAVLRLAAAGPWLVVSTEEKQVRFALESWKNPASSLADSGLAAAWRRGADVRGMFAPSRFAPAGSAWLDETARLAFTAGFDAKGTANLQMETRHFSEKAARSSIWPLVRILLALAGLICLFLVLVVLLAALGFGAWLKFLAIRAGVTPAPAPLPVEPSPAFREDAGMIPPANAPEPAESGTQDEVPPIPVVVMEEDKPD
ncbi:MAG: hypothetical protein LBE84_05805 [Planctomycetota bacterium]|jgi:hypothetical protein|nr:hypothetical protein [Planctomycetota bacterium]